MSVNITAKEVNELRQKTGSGMMDCKKALVESGGDFEKAIDILRKKGQKVSEEELKKFINIVQNEPSSSYSVVVTGGQLDSSRIISKNHASSLSDGWIDAWPAFLRDVLWQPLNIQIGFQWMTLGLLSGLVLGGSQALARACFSMMTPVKKSAEFFGFYAFTMKASSVIGPLIYVIAVNTSNQKLGVLIIWALIVIGTIYLSTIDVRKGAFSELFCKTEIESCSL